MTYGFYFARSVFAVSSTDYLLIPGKYITFYITRYRTTSQRSTVSSKTPKSTIPSRRSLVRSRHDAFTPCQVM